MILEIEDTAPKYIGIVGAAGAGKDTVADILVRFLDYHKQYLADPIKQVAMKYYECSWNDVYTQEGKAKEHPYMTFLDGTPMTNRNLLEQIGDKMQELDTMVLMRYIKHEARDQDLERIVVPDLRTEPQAQYFRDKGGIIVYVQRDDVEKDIGDHHTASFFRDTDHDIKIENDAMKRDLIFKVLNKFKDYMETKE